MNRADKARYLAMFPSPLDEGTRHDIAYRAVSTDTDDCLGHVLLSVPPLGSKNTAFFVRERSPWKEAWPYLEQGNSVNDMAPWWGQILATQHARSDYRFNSRFVSGDFPEEFSRLVQGRVEDFARQVVMVAVEYAAQVNQDFAEFSRVAVPRQ